MDEAVELEYAFHAVAVEAENHIPHFESSGFGSVAGLYLGHQHARGLRQAEFPRYFLGDVLHPNAQKAAPRRVDKPIGRVLRPYCTRRGQEQHQGHLKLSSLIHISSSSSFV
jgi:hypothetical protein